MIDFRSKWFIPKLVMFLFIIIPKKTSAFVIYGEFNLTECIKFCQAEQFKFQGYIKPEMVPLGRFLTPTTTEPNNFDTTITSYFVTHKNRQVDVVQYVRHWFRPKTIELFINNEMGSNKMRQSFTSLEKRCSRFYERKYDIACAEKIENELEIGEKNVSQPNSTSNLFSSRKNLEMKQNNNTDFFIAKYERLDIYEGVDEKHRIPKKHNIKPTFPSMNIHDEKVGSNRKNETEMFTQKNRAPSLEQQEKSTEKNDQNDTKLYNIKNKSTLNVLRDDIHTDIANSTEDNETKDHSEGYFNNNQTHQFSKLFVAKNDTVDVKEEKEIQLKRKNQTDLYTHKDHASSLEQQKQLAKKNERTDTELYTMENNYTPNELKFQFHIRKKKDSQLYIQENSLSQRKNEKKFAIEKDQNDTEVSILRDNTKAKDETDSKANIPINKLLDFIHEIKSMLSKVQQDTNLYAPKNSTTDREKQRHQLFKMTNFNEFYALKNILLEAEKMFFNSQNSNRLNKKNSLKFNSLKCHFTNLKTKENLIIEKEKQINVSSDPIPKKNIEIIGQKTIQHSVLEQEAKPKENKETGINLMIKKEEKEGDLLIRRSNSQLKEKLARKIIRLLNFSEDNKPGFKNEINKTVVVISTNDKINFEENKKLQQRINETQFNSSTNNVLDIVNVDKWNRMIKSILFDSVSFDQNNGTTNFDQGNEFHTPKNRILDIEIAQKQVMKNNNDSIKLYHPENNANLKEKNETQVNKHINIFLQRRKGTELENKKYETSSSDPNTVYTNFINLRRNFFDWYTLKNYLKHSQKMSKGKKSMSEGERNYSGLHNSKDEPKYESNHGHLRMIPFRRLLQQTTEESYKSDTTARNYFVTGYSHKIYEKNSVAEEASTEFHNSDYDPKFDTQKPFNSDTTIRNDFITSNYNPVFITNKFIGEIWHPPKINTSKQKCLETTTKKIDDTEIVIPKYDTIDSEEAEIQSQNKKSARSGKRVKLYC